MDVHHHARLKLAGNAILQHSYVFQFVVITSKSPMKLAMTEIMRMKMDATRFVRLKLVGNVSRTGVLQSVEILW